MYSYNPSVCDLAVFLTRDTHVQQACLDQYLPQSGCGSLSNRTCACQISKPDRTIFPCYATTCSAEDQTSRINPSMIPCCPRVNVVGANQFSFLVITALLLVLCNPIGGVGNGSNASISASVPSPSAFVGGAPVMAAGSWSNLWLGMGMLGFVACLLN